MTRLRRWAILTVDRCESRNLPSYSLPLNTSTWTALGPAPLLGAQTPGSLPASGRASAIAVHPTDGNTIYIGTAGGGVWKTTNANVLNPTWIPLTDNQASPFIGAITLAPSNPNIVYVGTGESELRDISFYGRGVLKSTDAGTTWTLLGSSVFDRTVISTIVVHPTNPNIVFVAVAGFGTDGNTTQQPGIYRSTDGGLTWSNSTMAITTTDGFSDLEADPTNFNLMWAACGVRLGAASDGVYRTSNALDPNPIWTLVANLPSGVTVGRTELAIAPSNNQVIYVSMHSPASDGVLAWFQTTNGGMTWIDRTAVVPATDRMWFCHNILVDPANANTVYFSGTTNLVRSADGGATWTPINNGADGAGPHVDHHGFALDNTGRFIAVGDGGIYRYTLSSNLWVSLNGVNSGRDVSGAINSIQFMGIAIHPTDPDFVIGGTQDNGTERFSDSLGWTLVEGGDGGDVIIDLFNPDRMWRANPVRSFGASAFARRSTNGGISWSSITSGIVDALNTTAFYPPMAADPGTVNRVFLGGTVLYVSTNSGTNWAPLGSFTFPNTIRAIGIGPASSQTIYVACGPQLNGTVAAAAANQVFVTTNNGLTWNERTPQIAGDFQAFAVDPTNSNVAYVVSANFSPTGDNIWRTSDAGQTWTSISSNLPEAPFYDVLLDPGSTNGTGDDVLFVGGDEGVYRSFDLGITWAEMGLGLPIAQVRDLEYSPATKILAAGTHGRGAWEILTGTPTTPGALVGTVYNDADGDGIRDLGEVGLSGWTVFRDDNNNNLLDVGSPTTFHSTNVPLPIPQVGTTTSTVSLNGLAGSIADLNVTLNITHTWDGDINGTLTSPAGKKITLFSHVGGGGQNFTNTTFDDEATTLITFGVAPFTGSFQPTQLLAALDGQSPNGIWTLTINDPFSGDSGTLNSWSIAVTTGEASFVTGKSGQYQFLNQPNGTYNLRRLLPSDWTATEPLSGAHVVTLSGPGIFDRNFGQRITPARVTSVIVNDGAAQRSRLTQLTVVFDSIVNFAGAISSAFKLVRTGPGAPSGEPAGLVTLSAVATHVNHSEAVVTFAGGLTDFGSLIDGRYTLTVLASQFGGAGFDGNGNGTSEGSPTDNYLLVGDPTTNKLFRLFGDADGNGTVSAADFNAFRLAYGSIGASPFDFDNNGSVSAADFNEFRTRYGFMVGP